MVSLGILLAFVCLPVVCVAGAAEEWTNRKGQTLTAELVTATEAEVELRTPDGKVYSIEVATLSDADQARVRAWLEAENAGAGEELNWDDDWPNSISVDDNEVTVVKEDAEKNQYIYHSPHYEFVCDARLGTIVVRRFARLFESTLEYCKALPISMQKPRTAGGRSERLRIELFSSVSDYMRAGGIPDSAGMYIGGRDVILVPLQSLGVERSGKGYTLDYDKGNKTLPHEITHQLTDSCYFRPGSLGWFTEGLAEYVGITPYNPGGGTFKVRTNRRSLVEYVTAYGEDKKGGRALGDEISMLPLREWMLMSYDRFLSDAQLNYGVGALVTYYFFHLDGDGDRVAITNFLKALREGKQGAEALEALRNGRTWDELAEDITRGWRSKGVKIEWEADSAE
jgi:hypothetical protein